MRIKIRQDSQSPRKESILRIDQTAHHRPDAVCFQILIVIHPEPMLSINCFNFPFRVGSFICLKAFFRNA
jgi:hypothetical protein